MIPSTRCATDVKTVLMAPTVTRFWIVRDDRYVAAGLANRDTTDEPGTNVRASSKLAALSSPLPAPHPGVAPTEPAATIARILATQRARAASVIASSFS